MNPKEHGNLTIEWCGPSHMKADDSVAAYLREQGYLVLAPSDTSPVAELVRATLAHLDANNSYALKLAEAWVKVKDDPAVRAWAERGRK